MRGELFMKNFVWILALALLFVLAIGAQAPKQDTRPAWAFLVPDVNIVVAETFGPLPVVERN